MHSIKMNKHPFQATCVFTYFHAEINPSDHYGHIHKFPEV